MPSKLYPRAPENWLGGSGAAEARQSDFLSDDVRLMLCTNAYTPGNSHEVKADITNEISGTGYTAGGLALASKTLTTTDADSWGVSRANSTAYAVGDIVRPAAGNGHLYRCIVAGTSAGAPPTFPTVYGQTVTDGGVTWAECGVAITVWDAADPAWGPGASFTARYGVVYNNTPTDKPLFVVIDFGSDVTVTNGTLTLTLSSLGLYHVLVDGF